MQLQTDVCENLQGLVASYQHVISRVSKQCLLRTTRCHLSINSRMLLHAYKRKTINVLGVPSIRLIWLDRSRILYPLLIYSANGLVY
jgi:hypothetical protein